MKNEIIKRLQETSRTSWKLSDEFRNVDDAHHDLNAAVMFQNSAAKDAAMARWLRDGE